MKLRNEKGSLSLEQVLFISAVAIITGGVGVFYSNIDQYFRGVSLSNYQATNTQTPTP